MVQPPEVGYANPPPGMQPGVSYVYPQPMMPQVTTMQPVEVQQVKIPGGAPASQMARYDLNGVNEFTYGLGDCFGDFGTCMSSR